MKTVEVAIVALLREPESANPIPRGNGLACPHILITKRLANTFYPGYWELPGGKIEPGETPEDAATREAREELGIEVEIDAVLEPIEHTYEHARVRLHACVGRVSAASPLPRNIQVAEHRWCSLDGIPWEAFLPANVRVITALRRYLDGSSRHARSER